VSIVETSPLGAPDRRRCSGVLAEDVIQSG
jgi:hypothetical protein